MIVLDKIPDQIGYLVLTEDGAVICSGGELENSEHIANVALELITLTDSLADEGEGYKKISVIYQDFCYIICLSNKKIYIVKKHYSAPKTAATAISTALQPDTSTPNINISNASTVNV